VSSAPVGGFARILVAVDGSEVSLRAAQHAARIAEREGAELHILHVVPTPPFEVPMNLAGYFEEARKQAKRWMAEIEKAVASYKVKVRTEIVVGAYSVVDAIVGYAETYSISLIVTGTRGKTPSSRLRVGSVASGLVDYATCSVLVIR